MNRFDTTTTSEFATGNEKIINEQIAAYEKNLKDLIFHGAQDDLYFFNRFILNIEEGKDKVKLVPFHEELCHFVTDNTKKKKLILVPRGHLKSTLITIGYSVFRIVHNPNIRILILNATWQMAVDFLTEIKRHLQTNKAVHEFYGDLSQTPDEWSQDRITIKRTDAGIKGPTVWATGVESNLVGSHPDLIIFDDVVNRDNSQTREQNENIIMRYKDTLDLLEPGGQLIVIGTRWTQEDLYGWIMDKDNNIYQSYDVLVKRAYEGNLETEEDFVPLWSEKFSQKELVTRLREEGWYHFSAQYLNDPIPMEDADFKKEYFQYYDLEEIKGKQLTKVMTIDPAISENKYADFTAMVVSGIDQFGNIFILDISRARMNPNQIVDKIFLLNEMWHPDQIGLETISYQKTLAYSLREEMTKRSRFLPIIEIQRHEQAKELRILGLQPLYQNRKIFHRRKSEFQLTTYLEDELASFPRGRHDDIIDAFSFQLEFLYPPKPKVTRYHHRFLY